MNYPQTALSLQLAQLERQQAASTDMAEIERLQDRIEQTTAAIELLIQHQQ